MGSIKLPTQQKKQKKKVSSNAVILSEIMAKKPTSYFGT
jgi:hypothetical protein